MKFFSFMGMSVLSANALASGLFERCENVIKNNEYSYLYKHFEKEKTSGVLCQQLDRYRFLYTNENSVIYCSGSREDNLECRPHAEGTTYPYIEKIKEFATARGKIFVLFRTSSMSRGVYREAYSVFYLVPNKIDPRGYKLSILDGASVYNGLYSDEGKACSNLPTNSVATQVSDDGIKISGDTMHAPRIDFNRKNIKCENNIERNEKISYVWSPGNYVFERELTD